MGEHNVEALDERKLREFTQALLADLRALAFMLEEGRIESGVRRIGAEQEMFLVDRSLRPAPLALEVLDQANDSRLITEIAQFNLEANLTPVALTGRCFHSLHEELKDVLGKARLAASFELSMQFEQLIKTGHAGVASNLIALGNRMLFSR